MVFIPEAGKGPKRLLSEVGMRDTHFSGSDRRFRPGARGDAAAITEAGLVYSGGSVLVRMRKDAEGQPDLAIGVDRDRMLAMLSIAYRRPMAASDVMPHVETAAHLWRRGDRALANLRLMFAGLGTSDDPTAGHRVALAACLLDQGWPPAALLEELGLNDASAGLEKYNPNHVPAGHGRRSGQFDFRSGSPHSPDGRITVAGADNDEEREIRELLGETTPKEQQDHHHLIEPPPPIPVMGGALFGASAREAVSAAASAAAAKVGPGKGPVYGTSVHTEFKGQIKSSGRKDLHPEQSYLWGDQVKYGTRGSVRVDVAHPTAERPHTAYDLKTGGASLTNVRREQFRMHLPKRDDGNEVEIYEIRP